MSHLDSRKVLSVDPNFYRSSGLPTPLSLGVSERGREGGREGGRERGRVDADLRHPQEDELDQECEGVADHERHVLVLEAALLAPVRDQGSERESCGPGTFDERPNLLLLPLDALLLELVEGRRRGNADSECRRVDVERERTESMIPRILRGWI